MAKKTHDYQVGICPNCSGQTRQRLEFVTNECNGVTTDHGKPNLYGEVHTLSLFRCHGCDALLLYKTHFCDFVAADEAQNLDPKWIFQLDNIDEASDFRDHSSLVYSTLLFQQPRRIKRELALHVPDKIKQFYDDALNARGHPNSFAVQIRRALEAICIDRGESGNNLKSNLNSLSAAGVFPPIVAEIADALRDAGNTGAHVKQREVTDEEAEAIDDFFHWVTHYVYEVPTRLEAYRKLLRPDLPEIISEDAVN